MFASKQQDDSTIDKLRLKKYIAGRRWDNHLPLSPPPKKFIDFLVDLFKMRETMKVFNEDVFVEIASRNKKISKMLKNTKYHIIGGNKWFCTDIYDKHDKVPKRYLVENRNNFNWFKKESAQAFANSIVPTKLLPTTWEHPEDETPERSILKNHGWCMMNRFAFDKKMEYHIFDGNSFPAMPLSLQEYIEIIGKNSKMEFPAIKEKMSGWLIRDGAVTYYWISDDKFREPNYRTIKQKNE